MGTGQQEAAGARALARAVATPVAREDVAIGQGEEAATRLKTATATTKLMEDGVGGLASTGEGLERRERKSATPATTFLALATMLVRHGLIAHRNIEFLNADPANLGMMLPDSSIATYETLCTHSSCIDSTCFDMHQISMPRHRHIDQIRSDQIVLLKYSSRNGTHDPLVHMHATHRSHEETQYTSRSRPQPHTYQICYLTYINMAQVD